MKNEHCRTINDCCCTGAVQANAYNVALLNGGMGDGSQLLQVDQSAVMYNNLVPLGRSSSLNCIVLVSECCYAYCGCLASMQAEHASVHWLKNVDN